MHSRKTWKNIFFCLITLILTKEAQRDQRYPIILKSNTDSNDAQNDSLQNSVPLKVANNIRANPSNFIPTKSSNNNNIPQNQFSSKENFSFATKSVQKTSLFSSIFFSLIFYLFNLLLFYFSSNDIKSVLDNPIFILCIFITAISFLGRRFDIFKSLDNTLRPSYIVLFTMQTFFVFFSKCFSCYNSFFMFFKDKNQVLNYCNNLFKNNNFLAFLKPHVESVMDNIHVFANSQNNSWIYYILGIIIFSVLLVFVFIKILNFKFEYERKPIHVVFWFAITGYYSWNIYNIIKKYFCSFINCSNNSLWEWIKYFAKISVHTENLTVFIEWLIIVLPAILIFLSVLYVVYLLESSLFVFRNKKSVRNVPKYDITN